MKRDERTGQILLALIALLSAAGGLSMVLQVEAIALLCPLVVVVTPVGLVAWRLLFRRGSTAGYDNFRWVRRGLVTVSLLGLAISLPAGLLFGAMWIHITEPWPLSNAQGPDTERSLAGYEKVIGDEPPEDVDGIFYKGYEIRDYQRFLRFSSCAESTRAVVLEGLERRPLAAASSFFTDERLSWWFSETDSSTFEHWARPSGYLEIWVNPGACTFYVVSWTT